MKPPTLFIGSSTEGLSVAEAIRDSLNKTQCVSADIWNATFAYGNSFLDDLLRSCEKYDLAAIVFTPDEKVTSRGKQMLSPRDNLLFEAGLFMGTIGRKRTFIICDRNVKKPTDLAGISLLLYNHAEAKVDPAAAVKQVCKQMESAVDELNFRHLTGIWHSRYRYPYSDKHPLVDEDVEVSASRDGLKIVSDTNAFQDPYVALGRRMMNHHFVGHWESLDEEGKGIGTGGAFVLTMHPKRQILYGFYAAPDAHGGVTHGSWVLVKKINASAAQLDAYFVEGVELLEEANQHCQLSLGSISPPPLKSKKQVAGRKSTPTSRKKNREA